MARPSMPRLRKLAADPLLHFLVIGALLFAAERLLHGEPSRDDERASTDAPPRRSPIVVTDDVRRMLAEQHERSYGKPPTDEEMKALCEGWIDEEVLYREGVLRGLDKDDPRIRNVVAQKMAFVLEQTLVLPPPTDDDVKRWFESHADRWSKPALVDFTQVFVAGTDTSAEARARGFLDQLEKGAEPAGMGDVFSGGRRYRRRSIADLAQTFGAEFTEGLDQQKEGTWSLRRSRFGFHVVRVDRHWPPSKPSLAEVRAQVEEDIRRERRATERARAIAKLREGWTVRVEAPSTPSSGSESSRPGVEDAAAASEGGASP